MLLDLQIQVKLIITKYIENYKAKLLLEKRDCTLSKKRD
jgi:hypothetical protein